MQAGLLKPTTMMLALSVLSGCDTELNVKTTTTGLDHFLTSLRLRPYRPPDGRRITAHRGGLKRLTVFS